MKTVVITGTSRGLGQALAEKFLAEGWKVVAVARRQPELAAHPNLQVEICDLTKGEDIATLVTNLKGVPVDVLLNNAGLYDWPSPDEDVASTDFTLLTNVFQVNSIAPKVLADALVSNLQAGETKLVVTITSGMGTYDEFDEYHAEHWAYSASKAAVDYAMVSFAELHRDLKSSLVNPGWVQTQMGGDEAPLKPSESAEAIFNLIADHNKKLPNAKIVDYEGKEMKF